MVVFCVWKNVNFYTKKYKIEGIKQHQFEQSKFTFFLNQLNWKLSNKFTAIFLALNNKWSHSEHDGGGVGEVRSESRLSEVLPDRPTPATRPPPDVVVAGSM